MIEHQRRRPPTFEQMVYTTEPGFVPRLKRDLRCLLIMWMMFKFWFFKGRKIRAAWAKAKSEGRTFLLDDDFKKML
jgi:hypothetical protein